MAFTSAFTGAQMDAALAIALEGANAAYDQVAVNIDKSTNISSVTDLATGRQDHFFTNNFADKFFRLTGSSYGSSTSSRGGDKITMDDNSPLATGLDSRTTSGIGLQCGQGSSGTSSAAPADRPVCQMNMNGELA